MSFRLLLALSPWALKSCLLNKLTSLALPFLFQKLAILGARASNINPYKGALWDYFLLIVDSKKKHVAGYMFFHLGNFLVIRCQKEAKGRKRDILRRRHHSACGLFRVNCLMSCYLLAATVSMRNSPQIPATGAKVHQAFEFDSAALTAMSKNSHSNKALCVCPMKKKIHWNKHVSPLKTDFISCSSFMRVVLSWRFWTQKQNVIFHSLDLRLFDAWKMETVFRSASLHL